MCTVIHHGFLTISSDIYDILVKFVNPQSAIPNWKTESIFYSDQLPICFIRVCMLKTDDTFPKFSFLKKNYRPPPYDGSLEVNFRFYIVSILHPEKLIKINSIMVSTSDSMVKVPGSKLDMDKYFSLPFCHYYSLIYNFLATTRIN
jgi:hypothetical protein